MKKLRRVGVCFIVLGFGSWCSAPIARALSSDTTQVGAPEELPPFVIEALSAPAVLKLSFRKHLPFMGVGTLTFTSVPGSWAKAGIKVGDRVVEFDGQKVYGMSLMHQFGPLLKRTLGPLERKEVASVPIIFGILSKETGTVYRMKLVVSHGGFTIYSYGF